MMASCGTKMTLPIHVKVDFCRMLDRKDGAYGVVLCELFPPKKNKKIHQLVFKHETITKTKLTMEDWRKLFQKCNKLQEFLDVVKKHTGQDPWIEENEQHDVALTAENPTGNHRDNNASDGCIKELSPKSRDNYSDLSPKSKTIFKEGYEARRRVEKRTFKATAAADETPSGRSTINKAVFECTPSTSGEQPGTTAPARRLFGDSEGTTRVPEQAAQLT